MQMGNVDKLRDVFILPFTAAVVQILLTLER